MAGLRPADLGALCATQFPALRFAEVRYRVKSWNRLDLCVEDTLAAVEAAGGKRTLIVGFSMGGAVAAVAASHPSVVGVLGLAPWLPDQLLVGFVLLLLLPHPWNGVGFAVAMIWEIVTILYCLWWSQRQAPQVGTATLLGLGAVVIEPCTPWGRVRLQGETWQALAEVAAERGALVRVRSVEGLTLHVEAERAR